MKKLDLSYNELFRPGSIIIKNVFIESLDLSSNSITELNSDLNVCNHINLSHNLIPVINQSLITKLQKFESIDFGKNRFLCQDCQIQEFQEILKQNKSKLLWLNKSSDMLCYFPDNSQQKVMDTEYNKKLCEGVVLNVALISGLSTTIIIVILFIAGLLIYVYRFEIAYVKHLINIKRKERKEITEKNGCRYDVFVSYCSKYFLFALCLTFLF
jgi:hypothetical protein